MNSIHSTVGLLLEGVVVNKSVFYSMTLDWQRGRRTGTGCFLRGGGVVERA